MTPTTCPVCRGDRVIVILRERRLGLCYDCGSQWLETLAGERAVLSVGTGPRRRDQPVGGLPSPFST
jgi:hypothetical protein